MRNEWLLLAGLLATPVEAQEPMPGTSLDLRTVVESALVTHPTVASAGARLEAARAAGARTRSARLPTVSATAGATRFEEPMVVAPLHGFDIGMPPRFDETLYQGHATAAYTLYDGGARGARTRAAEASENAATAGVAAARDAILAEAVATYLSALTAAEVLVAHEQQVRALESELERSQLMLEEGRSARVAVLRTEAALSRVHADRAAAAENVQLAMHRLVRVSGLPRSRVLGAMLAPIGLTDADLPDRDALVTAALSANPRLAQAERQATAAETQVAASRSAFFPRVELSGRYSAYGSPSTDLAPEWQAGVQLSYPLFTGGARGHAVAEARAEADAARASARLSARAVMDAVDEALLAYRSFLARSEALEAAVRQSEEVVRIEALALRAGAGVQTDYLRAEADLFEARAALAEATYATVDARVKLARATGELTMDWLLRVMEGVDR
jgi:outer membrane protein